MSPAANVAASPSDPRRLQTSLPPWIPAHCPGLHFQFEQNLSMGCILHRSTLRSWAMNASCARRSHFPNLVASSACGRAIAAVPLELGFLRQYTDVMGVALNVRNYR
jgi:hypothetical protein